MDPALDADFYALEQLLDPAGLAVIRRVREFMERSVEPVINQYWTREEFPHDLIPAIAELGIAGTACSGYGCPGGSSLLDGMIALELARVDPSIATFMGVHGGLAMGSIYLCGSEEQKQRWLPAMARMEKIGAFALTEPEVGSGVAGGLTTTAQRDGDMWVLNGEKKWIGNATFADYVIVWARDVADNQVKGFVVEAASEGFTPVKMRHKIALRVVQNAQITLDNVRVHESSRLQAADSFRDTAKVLRLTRAGVAWQATGCARGAYEHALAYATSGTSSAGLSPDSSWCRTCWSGCSPTSPRRRACACGCPSCRIRARQQITIRRWLRRSAQSGCVRRSVMHASCSAATASCSTIRSAGSSPTPRPSTPTRARARSTR